MVAILAGPFHLALRDVERLFQREVVEPQEAAGGADPCRATGRAGRVDGAARQLLLVAQFIVRLLEVGARYLRLHARIGPPFELGGAAIAVDRIGIAGRDDAAGDGDAVDLAVAGRVQPLLVAALAAIGAGQHETPAVIHSEPRRERRVGAIVEAVVGRPVEALAGHRTAVRHADEGIADEGADTAIERRAAAQVDDAADRIALHVRSARLDDFESRHRGGRDRLHVELPVLPLGGRQNRAIERADGEVGVHAADADIAALVLIKDRGDAGQPAEAVGDVVVGLLPDLVAGEELADPVVVALGGDGLRVLPRIAGDDDVVPVAAAGRRLLRHGGNRQHRAGQQRNAPCLAKTPHCRTPDDLKRTSHLLTISDIKVTRRPASGRRTVRGAIRC